MEYLDLFFQKSIQNHIDFITLSKKKSFFVFEIKNGINDSVIEYLEKSLKKKTLSITTSTSSCGYIKENHKLIKKEVSFETGDLQLQHDIVLSGYSLYEEIKDHKQWSDDDHEDHKQMKFSKSVTKEIIVFENEFFNVTISSFIIIKAKISTNKDALIFIKLLKEFLKTFSMFPIMTLEKEKEVREKLKPMKLENISPSVFNYTYISDPKVNSLSIVIKDYLYTLPVYRITIEGILYHLDCYNNLTMISKTDKEYIDQGFFNLKTFKMIDIEEYPYTLNTVSENDALLYINDKENGFEIHTHGKNMYTDKIINNVFKRQTYQKTDKINLFNFILSRNAMKVQKIKEVDSILKIYTQRIIVKRVCNHIDTDYLLSLPPKIKKEIKEQSEKVTNNWMSEYFINMLSISYDESNPIIFKIDDSKLSDIIIKETHLNLEQELENEKKQIDVFHNYRKDKQKFEYYTSSTKLLDQLKFYSSKEVQKRVHIKGSITNAWMKCWEMIHTFNLVPKDHTDKFTIFCNAEFPGAFILALNHYIKTSTPVKKFEWYANSLWPTATNKEILKDSFDLYKKYTNRWLMNSENGGSVTDPKMIQIIKDRLYDKVDLYTSDIGIGAEENEEEQEAPLNLGQVICALNTLKNGGMMVCKMFLFFKPFNMSLLRVLSTVFEEFYVTKPLASRGGNSEIYIIGKGYKRNQSVIDQLMYQLVNWSKDTMTTFFEPITQDFYVRLVYMLYYIYGRQLHFLKKNMDCVKAMYVLNTQPRNINVYLISNSKEKEEFELRKNMVESWKNKFPVPYLPKQDDL
jgi:hypothetical protein